LAIGVLVVAPAVITLVLIRLRLDSFVTSFVPNYWNDQVGYWHKIATFAKTGFGGGYYSPDETAVPFDSVRYGVNAPWFPALYGSVASVTGWQTWTSIPYNLVALGLGAIVFVRLADLDVRGIAMTALVLLVTWPVLLYIPTASMESLQQAFAMVLAGIFIRAIARGPDLRRREHVLSIAFLAAVSLTRFSWALLLPCLLLLYLRTLSRRNVLIALAGSLVAAAALARVSAMFQPLVKAPVADRLTRISESPLVGSRELLEFFRDNLHEFLYPSTAGLDPTTTIAPSTAGLDLTNAQSWEIVALIALAITTLVLARWRPKSTPTWLPRLSSREAAFHLANLGVMLIAAMALYQPNGYFRVLGAQLLLSLLVLVGCHRWAPLAVVAVVNLLLFPSFMDAYKSWQPNFGMGPDPVRQLRADLSAHMRFDPDADSPWCNTVLMRTRALDWRMIAIPPGFGVSYVYVEHFPRPPKSRWVFLAYGDNAKTSKFVERARTAGGILYENPRSACKAADGRVSGS
jgi:hypothetical protein